MKIEKTDMELVEGLKNGDMADYVELVERYTQKVHNLAIRITRNTEDAEEVLQDTFVTVYKKVAAFEGKSAFSSWLYRVAANHAFMKLRKRRQTPATSLEEISPSVKDSWMGRESENSDVNYITSRHELRSHLKEAIEALPEDYKQIFILRDVDGLSNQEVGEIVGLSIPAVKSRLHRSRLMLRKQLQNFYSDYQNEETISYGSAREGHMAAA